ncbi:MAG: ABC transporter ATP-binding protein [Myxococcales bacterium]|nr:ABC transporter ATP-binding protein [Myxococcales bacterium]
MSEPQERTDWGLIRRLGPYLSPHRGWLVVVALCTPLGVAADLVPPILLKHGIDENIAHGDYGGLTATAALFFGVVLVGFTLQSMGLYALQLIGLRALAALRRGVFGSVLSQGQRFFDKRTTGSLMTRTTTDVEAIYESLTFGAVGLITDALVILGTLGIMLAMDWRMTLVAFSIAPIIIGVVNVVRKRLRALFSEIRAILSKLNGFFAEQINGMTVLQLYGGEAQARHEFRAQAHHYMERYKAANWWDAGLYAVMDGMSALSVGLVIFFAASRFGVDDALTLGLLVAFIDYINKVFVPIREFSGRIATIQRAIAALEKVLSLAETNERVAPGQVPLPTPAGAVQFEGVRFAYGPDKPAVLQDVSFSVKAGEVVALVGATGSGKTTIGRLLQRRYDGYEGSIRLDGQELRDVRVEDVCHAITVVHQDAHLFEATIAENITLWNPGIDEASMRTAAERARASRFIDALPDGYDHAITERGGNLSAGQRQLLTIARAMACRSPVVILDEATASVDSLTEKLIDEAMDALFADRTVLVIAHRLSTVAKADRILVLHHGHLVEQGSHEELLARGGRYKLLVETGFAL